MLFDHIGEVFPASTPDVFRFIGRIAFPIYAYMIAQGCKYTRNINKYLIRLGIFAIISEIPFDIAFMHYKTMDDNLHLNIDFLHNTNVFYTLFLGVACISVYEKLKLKKHPWIALLPIPLLPTVLLANFLPDTFPISALAIAAIVFALYTVGALCFAEFLSNAELEEKLPFKRKVIPLLAILPIIITAGAFKVDYDMFGVILIFLLYLAKPENKVTRTIVLTAGVIYHYGLNLFSESGDFIDGVFVVTERTLNQHNLMSLLFAFISVILIFFYNGKQGKKVKWAFYAFYPAHIAVLAAIWFVFARG